jgi:hypothetical protein
VNSISTKRSKSHIKSILWSLKRTSLRQTCQSRKALMSHNTDSSNPTRYSQKIHHELTYIGYGSQSKSDPRPSQPYQTRPRTRNRKITSRRRNNQVPERLITNCAWLSISRTCSCSNGNFTVSATSYSHRRVAVVTVTWRQQECPTRCANVFPGKVSRYKYPGSIESGLETTTESIGETGR